MKRSSDSMPHGPRPFMVRSLARAVTILVSLVIGSETAIATTHPPLVDPGKTRCVTCHGDVLEAAVIHQVVDSCDQCHQFSQKNGITTVELTSGQPALCVSCHVELEAAAEGIIQAPHAPVTASCLECHDAHGSGFPRLLRQPVPDICLTCHDPTALDATHGLSVARTRCTRCHQPHGGERPALLVAGEPHAPFAGRSCDACHRRGLRTRAAGDASQICFACHDSTDFRAAHVHTAVSEGRCLGCHDPHISEHAHLLTAERSSLCTSCHPATVEKTQIASAHTAFVEACDTCHDHHTGDHEYQLVDGVPGLCTMCHDLDDPELRTVHIGADLPSLACNDCHDPHGSNEAHLIVSRSVHPPFTDGNCGTCHEGGADALIEDGTSALCLACHAGTEETIATAGVNHEAVDAVDCSNCHSAHASANRMLIRDAEGGICGDCHHEQFAADGEFSHGAIARIGCESCHEPHGSEHRALLRSEDVNHLCLGCHDRDRWDVEGSGDIPLLARFDIGESEARSIPTLQLTNGTHGHPILYHPTVGAVTDASASQMEGTELGCLSCHDPHKGGSPALLAKGAVDICGSCHDK